MGFRKEIWGLLVSSVEPDDSLKTPHNGDTLPRDH